MSALNNRLRKVETSRGVALAETVAMTLEGESAEQALARHYAAHPGDRKRNVRLLNEAETKDFLELCARVDAMV